MERRKRKGDTENGKLCKAGGEALGERGEGGSEVWGMGRGEAEKGALTWGTPVSWHGGGGRDRSFP